MSWLANEGALAQKYVAILYIHCKISIYGPSCRYAGKIIPRGRERERDGEWELQRGSETKSTFIRSPARRCEIPPERSGASFTKTVRRYPPARHFGWLLVRTGTAQLGPAHPEILNFAGPRARVIARTGGSAFFSLITFHAFGRDAPAAAPSRRRRPCRAASPSCPLPRLSPSPGR